MAGGIVHTRDGAVEIKTSADRVFLHVWPNKAKIEVFVHQQPVPGEHYSDRIRMIITSKDGNERGWLMNDQDVHAIVFGLTQALDEYSRLNILCENEHDGFST